MAARVPDVVVWPLSIRLFGPLDVRVHGSPLPRLRSRKGHWLLALLALRHDREVDRTWLAGTLWPDSPEVLALRSLRISLKDLRRALGEEAARLRSPTPRTLCLDLEGAFADLAAFDAGIAASDEAMLEHALACYRGPLLEGCTEEWVFQERQAREEAYLHARERLAERAHQRGDHAAAAHHLRLALVVHPSRETAQRGLMTALAAGGDYAAATEAYRDFRAYLHRELSAEPASQTQTLYQQIREEACRRAQEPPRTTTDHSLPPALGGRGSLAGSYRPPPGELDASPGSRAESSADGLQDKQRPIPALQAAPESPTGDARLRLESVGGAVPLDSPFYVVRSTDQEFHEAIARRDSIVLVKGARQMGKTSLLGRGLQRARGAGSRGLLIDFQQLNAAQRASAEAFFLAVGAAVADQLDLDVFPDQVWDARFGPSMNFNRYMRREVLGKVAAPIVWALDEVDQLAACAFGGEVFGLLRSWHNQRVTDPSAPWSRLTLAIAYATEAHLFIADVNQSPFNVGTRLELQDFTPAEVEDLNERHGGPLRDRTELGRFYELVGGHPYLVRCALHEMVAREIDIATVEAVAAHEDGPFSDHLRRLLVVLARCPELDEAVRAVLQGHPCPTAESFYRLRSAGIITGPSAREAKPRCRLYAAYLSHHLL